MGKVKYAIIGFGGIAENRIAKEGFACDKSRFKPLAKAELVGATDANPARKSAVAALGLKWYGSTEEILADKNIDAVFVATNNRTHAKIAMEAMKAGKHVIVEKPVATSIDDAKAMIKMAEASKLSLSVDHMMVYNALNQKARKLVASGALGEVNDACFHMEFAFGYDPAEAASWRCSNIEEMGGPIGDVASHCFYVAEFIFGQKIKKIAAVYLPKIVNMKAEDGAYIKFWMEDGRCASAKVAFSEFRGGLGGTLSNLGYEIYGSKAALRSYGTLFQLSGYADEPIKMRLELDDFKKVKKVAPGKIENIYQCVINHHAEAVISGKNINAQDGLRNLQLCDAAHESARNGGKVVEV